MNTALGGDQHTLCEVSLALPVCRFPYLVALAIGCIRDLCKLLIGRTSRWTPAIVVVVDDGDCKGTERDHLVVFSLDEQPAHGPARA